MVIRHTHDNMRICIDVSLEGSSMRVPVLVEQGGEEGVRGFIDMCTVLREISTACSAPTSLAFQGIL